jgi:hypothetical protein
MTSPLYVVNANSNSKDGIEMMMQSNHLGEETQHLARDA